MRYILPGVEIRMGLPEFKNEIDEVERMISDGPAISAPMLTNGGNLLDQIEAYLTNFDAGMGRWIASLHPAILKSRSVVERASNEGEDALTAAVVETATVRLLVGINRGIKLLEGAAPLKANLERLLQQRAAKFVSDRARALSLKVRVNEVFTRLLDAAYDLRDQVKVIEYDFHPDCRGTGEIISTQDDLDAYFSRLRG